MKAIRETVQAGKLLFTKITTRRKRDFQKRAERKNPTTDSVAKINYKMAVKDLNIKLHHNFKPGDLHVSLTYAGDEPSKEEARKNLDNFKRRLRTLYKKQGVYLKWIEVTEYENRRIHHHFILSYVDPAKIAEIWEHGYIHTSHLDKTGDWRALADYLIKETSKTFRKADTFSKRRYKTSRSVASPDVRVEEVSIRQIFEAKATKGYYIDQESIWQGINPDTDRPYLEFVQVSLDSNPYKKYKRGRKRKYKKERIRTRVETQMSLAL